MSPAPHTLRLARRAAVRALLRDFVHTCGRALALGALASALLVASDRIAGGFADWRVLASLPLAAALLSSIAICFLRRPRPLAAAAELDDTLRLKDTLSSALAFAESGPGAQNPAFVHAATEDAERAATTVRLSRAMPIRARWEWSAWPAAIALAMALGLFAPYADWSGKARRATKDETRRLEVAADVARAAEEAAKIAAPAADLATPEDLKTLDQLHQQLARGQADPEQVRTKAAATLGQLADKFDSESERSRLEMDKFRERLAAAPKPDPGPPGESADSGDASSSSEAEALASALRQADPQAAAAAAEKLAEQARSMSPEEREKVAEELEQLAETLDRSPAAGPSSAGSPSASGRESGPPSTPASNPAGAPESTPQDTPASRELESQGIPPDKARELATKDNPEEISRELQKQGVPPESADHLAQKTADESRERQAKESAGKRADNLRDSLRRAAEELKGNDQPPSGDKPQEPRQPHEPSQGRESPSPNDRPAPQPGDKPPSRPGEKAGDKPGEQPGAKQGERQGEKPGDKQGQKPADQPGDKPGSKSSDKPGEKPDGKPGDKPSDRPGDKPGDKPGQKPGEQAGDKPGDKPQDQPDKPGDKPGDQPGDKPGDKPSDQPGDKAGDKPGDQPGDKPGQRPGDKPGDSPGQQPGSTAPRPVATPNTPGIPSPGGLIDPARGSQRPAGAQPQTPGQQPGAGQEPGDNPANPGAHAPAPPGTAPPADVPDSSKPGGTGLDDLHKQLKDWAEGQSRSGDNQKRARELREQAQRLLENASPEERERARKWAEQLARESGKNPPHSSPAGSPDGPGASTPPRETPAAPASRGTQPVDARREAAPGEKPDERVIARWLSNQSPDRSAPASRESMSGVIQEAAKGAERAIEQQEVPRRYSDLVRRVFKRYSEQPAPPRPK